MLRNILAGVLLAAFAAVLLFTERDYFLSDKHFAVSHAADLPANTPETVVDELRGFVAAGGVHVPLKQSAAAKLYAAATRDGEGDEHAEAAARGAAIAESWRTARPELGYLVQEFTFLGMPFGWHGDYGLSLTSRTLNEQMAAPLGESGRALVARTLGEDPAKGSIFPFWMHMWGWLFVAGLVLWGVLRQRWVVRRRAEEGII